jgi:LacI family transcriptional regulator
MDRKERKGLGSRRVTIKDLAERLHTTPSTVSRALRDQSGVGEKMRHRIKELAAEMDYQPNAVAAGLRKGKSHTIGVIVPRVNRDFFSGVIAGIEEVAYESRYSVIICQTHDRLDKEKQYVETLLGTRVDGILVSLGLETDTYEHFEKVVASGTPLIFFDRVPNEMDVSRILIDDYQGSFRVVRHMIGKGYRRIVHFAGPEYLNVYRDRKRGYLDALKQSNIPVDEELIIYDSLTIEAGRRSMEELLKKGIVPDALFSSSDYSALGALLYMQEKGYRIPQDFGVAGFSNEKFTSYIRPSLTTVDQQSNEMGKYCMNLFLREVRGDAGPPGKVMLNPEVLFRESTSRDISSNK